MKTKATDTTVTTERPSRGLLVCVTLLALALGLLFARSLNPSLVVFSNDGPFGGLVSELNRMPAIMTGLWQDLNWLGGQSPSPAPSISATMRLLTSPLVYSKIFCPASLFILGLCAWFGLRKLKLAPVACVLGALAAALSSHFLSTACWGVASQVICVGMSFVAAGLLYDLPRAPFRRWASVALVGMAVGMGITEGYDIGALFSLFIAGFAVWAAWVGDEGAPARRLGAGVVRVAVVAVFAAFIGAHTLNVLVGTQIKGVAGMEQSDTRSKQERWDWATQWSFPPQEILRVIIPGLFGYRMDTPKDLPESISGYFANGAYWGRAGETPGWTEHHKDPEWNRTHPGSYGRFSGGGEYAGVLVVVVALWATFQSFRRQGSAFDARQRKMVWFWSAAALVSLLLAFGRYMPFYQFFYMLPYFSTIRNPAKFTHTFHWSLVILFAYGVHGLSVRYLEGGVLATAHGLKDHLKQWWAKAPRFDRAWTSGCLVALAVSLLGWMMYSTSRTGLEQRIQDAGFDQAMAARMAGFSIREVGLYLLVAIVAVALLTLTLSGSFGGRRWRLGAVLMGALLVLDLGRGALPYIIYQNWEEKYATNPVIDFLREKPYEHRVAIVPYSPPRDLSLMSDVYRIEWAQHQFQYYNIQSLDIVQMPRPPADMVAFEGALRPDSTNTMFRAARRWELTNTRYLLGAAGFVEVLNQQLDPLQHRFRVAFPFDVVPRPGVSNPTQYEQLTAVAKPEGPYAIIEFTGALPRAKLYTNWQVAGDDAALKALGSAGFDPEKTVLVAEGTASPSGTNQAPGTVTFTGYAPKRISLKAEASAPSVLLLNDKYDPNWHVTVDGKPAALLRCNYIMRGVQVPAGTHQVEFHFAPPIQGLYVSLAAIALGLALIGFLALPRGQS